MNRALWILQILLGLLFLLAGGTKLVMSVEEMNKGMPQPLPGAFLHFIGVAEILGGLGLILPGLLHIRTGLTPLAAACLIPVMVGAVWVTLIAGQGAAALLPLIVGLLLIFVAWYRWQRAPLR